MSKYSRWSWTQFWVLCWFRSQSPKSLYFSFLEKQQLIHRSLYFYFVKGSYKYIFEILPKNFTYQFFWIYVCYSLKAIGHDRQWKWNRSFPQHYLIHGWSTSIKKSTIKTLLWYPKWRSWLLFQIRFLRIWKTRNSRNQTCTKS